VSQMRTAAAAVLQSELTDKLLDEYINQVTKNWIGTNDKDKQYEQWSRVHAASEIATYIKNKCEDIVNGAD
jgi:hypothetical protein